MLRQDEDNTADKNLKLKLLDLQNSRRHEFALWQAEKYHYWPCA